MKILTGHVTDSTIEGSVVLPALPVCGHVPKMENGNPRHRLSASLNWLVSSKGVSVFDAHLPFSSSLCSRHGIKR